MENVEANLLYLSLETSEKEGNIMRDMNAGQPLKANCWPDDFFTRSILVYMYARALACLHAYK